MLRVDKLFQGIQARHPSRRPLRSWLWMHVNGWRGEQESKWQALGWMSNVSGRQPICSTKRHFDLGLSSRNQ